MKKKLKRQNSKDDSFKGDSITRRKDDDAPVEIALKKIKEMMYHHELIPGQKVIYQELAKKFNMSITPIIQALNRLQYLNIVQCARNRGYYIGESDPAEARDLFMAREAMETYLVPIIVEKITDEKINAIENAMKEHVNAGSAPEHRRMLMIKDTRFHLKMIECSESKVFYGLCQMIFEQIYLKYRPEYMIDKRLKAAAEEHQMVLDALRERDVKRTRRLIKRHIKNGAKHIVGGLGRGTDIEM